MATAHFGGSYMWSTVYFTATTVYASLCGHMGLCFDEIREKIVHILLNSGGIKLACHC